MYKLSALRQDENDVYILTKVSDILHSVFSSYKEKVLPWFEQLLQLIVQLIVSTSCFCTVHAVPLDGVGGSWLMHEMPLCKRQIFLICSSGHAVQFQ